ncbi:hypothetical protein F0U59_07515 [Archangium gephyra]|nr:hypothetical protein F0U59_07515 [Archangium gephyra]
MNWHAAVRWGLLLLAPGLGGWARSPLVPPSTFSVSIQGGPAFCPGARAQLVVHAIHADGSRSARALDPAHFLVRTTGTLSVDDRGGVVLDTDPQRLEAGPLEVRIEAAGAPELPAVTLAIPVHYGCDFRADFRGRPGAPGQAGAPGVSGEPGENAPSFPGYPALLTSLYRGRPGGAGERGGDGGAGEPGGELEVQVTRVPDVEPARLKVLVRERRSGRTGRFLVDLLGAPFSWTRARGPEVRAGLEARGQGGRGTEGWPPVQSGLGGQAGSAGNGGAGGDAGRLLVRASPEAEPYLDRLLFFAHAARAGRAGAPGAKGPAGDAIEPGRRYVAPEWLAPCGVRSVSSIRLPPPLREAETELRVEPLPEPW